MPTTPGRVRATAYAFAVVNVMTALVGMLLIQCVNAAWTYSPTPVGITLGAVLITGYVTTAILAKMCELDSRVELGAANGVATVLIGGAWLLRQVAVDENASLIYSVAGGLGLGHTLTRLIADKELTGRDWRGLLIANLAPAAVWFNMSSPWVPDHIPVLCALLGALLAIRPIRARHRKTA